MWLVTGGCGYIGSHVVRSFTEHGEEVVVLDDLSTGTAERLPLAIDVRIARCSDAANALSDLPPDSLEGVVHLAGMKDPRASMREPLNYWRSNVAESLSLLEWATSMGIRNFIFSSSSSVYGPRPNAQTTDSPNPVSTYGFTKLTCERMLGSVAHTGALNGVSLRYFNVVGAGDFAASADTGADNVVPRFANAIRNDEPLTIYGFQFPTPDGTCIRDYIDVRDLADAHWLVANQLRSQPNSVPRVINVSRGIPVSVLEIAKLAEGHRNESTSRLVLVDPAPGDPAVVFGEMSACLAEWGWSPRYSLDQSISDHFSRMG